MELEYRKINSEDLDQVDHMLVHELFLREPLAIAFGITDAEWYASWMRKLTQPRTEAQKVSFGCFQGDKLIGLCLNVIDYKEKSKNITSLGDLMKEYAPYESYPKVDTMIGNLHKEIDVFGGLEEIFHFDLLVVDPHYGRRGIGFKLIQLGMTLAEDMGLKGGFAETTGKYSGNIMKRLQFERLISLKYDENEATKDKNLDDHDELIIWRINL
eukprot:TRINITY_DN5451_c0_g1_i1.p1 TRINITY_DN5451_c0_g1~~TRINITY_DN5451_c0_g1_i1.p1  ORF type:complete len:213 (+),score=23.87 TRINITY_DN5451_c0_g1_i1:161-799(+)